jgi:1-acyl-sn-glycerol-3-phosphate acyltransferase
MRTLLYWVFVFLFYIYTKLLLIFVTSGRKNGSNSPCIYVVNHPNVFDPMYLLSLLGKRVTVLITEHAFQVPVFGTLLRYTKQIQVTSCGRDAYEEALKRLQNGESILLFPEGDCNSGKHILPFHTGAVRLAMETKMPIVPIGIYLDPMKIWKRHTKIGKVMMIFTWYRYGWYGVTFGNEVRYAGDVENRNMVREQTIQLRKTVLSLARQSKKSCQLALQAGKRKAKRQFHSALRFAYRLVCFLLFTRVH